MDCNIIKTAMASRVARINASKYGPNDSLVKAEYRMEGANPPKVEPAASANTGKTTAPATPSTMPDPKITPAQERDYTKVPPVKAPDFFESTGNLIRNILSYDSWKKLSQGNK